MAAMTKFETPLMVALLASLAIFLFTHALVVFVAMIACATGVVAIAIARGVRA
jgi:hypothetical protein